MLPLSMREMVLSLSRSSESIKHQNLSLFNLRCLSESRKHVPQVQNTMPVVKYVKQLWHCALEVISHISKYSVFPMLRIVSLRLLAELEERLILFQVGLSTHRDLDASQIDESTFFTASLRVSFLLGHLKCGNPWILKSMLRNGSPRTLFRYGLPRTLCHVGRRMLSLQSWVVSWRPIMQIRLEYNSLR